MNAIRNRRLVPRQQPRQLPRLLPRLLPVLGALIALSLACTLPAGNLPTQPPLDSTQSAQTVEAIVTRMAAQAISVTPASGGNASQPNQNTAPTIAPSATLRPSSTPVPTYTQVVLPSITPTPTCDVVGFVSDVSVPDGSVIPAGAQFTKTWRLKNKSNCVWSTGYSVVFDTGNSLGGPSSQMIDQAIGPGDTFDVSIKLTAPTSAGSYRGYWRMRNPSGVLFPIGGNSGSEKFYVDVKVITATASGAGYDFAANVCSATWTGGSKTISCAGQDGSSDGFVIYQGAPKLETGYQDDEPALLTNPPKTQDGVIRGKYPSYTVQNGDYFDTIIGCAYQANNCSVRFQLDYQITDGSIQTLGAWVESYDNAYTNINLDLSSLAGKNVNFILTVMANGESNNDRAQWLAPMIKHK